MGESENKANSAQLMLELGNNKLGMSCVCACEKVPRLNYLSPAELEPGAWTVVCKYEFPPLFIERTVQPKQL